MTRAVFLTTSLIIFGLFLLAGGCEKEKIVESTEYIHDIEYVQLPGDTVYQIDSVYNNDSTTIYITDTVFQIDSVFGSDSVTIYITDTLLTFDTIVQVNNIYDTVLVHDTVEIVQHHYDTTIVVDTVLTVQCNPNECMAVAALQYYTDPLVLEFVSAEFGLSEGWIYYLSAYQLQLSQASSSIYDIAGYIDYWTPDWSGFYGLEFYWRVVYTGGDPADPRNWQMTEPATASAGHEPGLKLTPETARSRGALR